MRIISAMTAAVSEVNNAHQQALWGANWRSQASTAQVAVGYALQGAELLAFGATARLGLSRFSSAASLVQRAASTLSSATSASVHLYQGFLSFRNSNILLLGTLSLLGCGGGVAHATLDERPEGEVPNFISNQTPSANFGRDAMNPIHPGIGDLMNRPLYGRTTVDAGEVCDASDAASTEAGTSVDAAPVCPSATPAENVEARQGMHLGTCRVEVSFRRPNAETSYIVNRYEGPCEESAPSPLFPEVGASALWDPLNLTSTGPNEGIYCYCVVPELPYRCQSDAAVRSACATVQFTGACEEVSH